VAIPGIPRTILRPPAGTCLLGAYPGGGNAAPAAFEAANMLDGQLPVVSRYEALDGTWPGTADKALVTAGRVLAFDWATRLSAGGNATWAQITSGTYDTQITAQANYLAAWGQPVFIGLCNEFDGGVNITKSGPLTDYAAYYRHVHGIVAPIAPNVIWCWCVTSSNDNTATAAAFPGAAYVDWLFADPYDANLNKGSPVTNPTATYSPWVTWVTSQSFYTGQPLGIFETGVDNSADDATEATWIDNIPGVMAALGIQCWIWFNSSGSLGNTSITPGSLSAAALASIGNSPVFNPGTTQAGAGVLAGAGSMGAAAVRVRAGAVLAGTGTMGAAATIPAGSGGAAALAGAGTMGGAAVQRPAGLMAGAGTMTAAGPAALGTPYVIATGTSGTAVATQAAAVTATSGPGDCILVGCSVNSVSESPSSVADTKNTYVKIASQNTEIEDAIFAAYNTTSLVSGTDTITGTFSSALGNAKNVYAIGIPGVAAASAADQSASAASAASAAPGATLPALSQAAEIVLAWADYATAGGTIAWTGPLTQAGPILQLLSNQKSAWAWADTSAVTSQAYGGTITSAKWAFLVVSLLAAARTQAGAALAGAGSMGGAAVQRIPGAATMAGAGTLGSPVTGQPGGAGWSFAVSGTPFTDGYFILATGQAASVTAGDYFSDTAGLLPGGCVVTSLSAPVGGFVNAFFTPPATSALNSGDTCFQVRMAALMAGAGTLGGAAVAQAGAVLAGAGTLTAGQAVTGPIGVPYAIGSASVQATTAGLEIPVGASTGQGDAIVVGASVNSLTEWPVACNDTQGNFYLLAVSNFTSYDGAVFVAVSGPPAIPGGSPGIGQTQPLAAGTDLITVSYNAADTSCMNGLAIGCPGLPEAAVTDIAVAAAGTGSAPSLASGALAQNSELIVAFADNQTGGGIMTWAAPFAAGVLISDVFTLFNQVSSIAAIVADSASPVTAAGTLGASSKWDLQVVSVEGAGILAGAASLAGAGTLGGAVTATSPVLMAGAGALTAAGTVAQPAAATLAGAGTMGAAAAQSPLALLAGSGSLGPVTAQQVVAAAAVMAGAGTLGPVPARQAAPSLMAGAGTVAVLDVQQPAALLAGAGVVGAPSVQVIPALLAGAGSMGAPAVQRALAVLAGTGTMAAAGTATAPSGAMLPGTGTLTGVVTQPVTALLAGSGTMTGPATAAAAALMAGSGTLGFVAASQLAPSLLAGAGVLAATAAQTAHGAASLAGSGSLGSLAALAGGVLMAGAGTLTAQAGQSPLALLAGSGSMGAAAVQVSRGTAVLAGTGSMAGAAASTVTGAALIAGAGTLASASVTQAAATAAGAGTMGAAASQTVRGFSLLPGAGTLAAAVMQAAGAVLAGAGTILAASAQDTTAALAGAGTMGGAALTAAAALLAGSGQLGTPVSALAAGAVLAGTGILAAAAAQQSGALLEGTGTLAGVTAVFTVLISSLIAGALVQEITAGGIAQEITAGALS
jgi:hypothetical protein